MSEPNAQEAKENEPNNPADLPPDPSEEESEEEGENLPKEPKKSQVKIDPAALFSSAPPLDQLEQQVNLLTAAMTENMVLAAGAAPDLTEGPYPDLPRFGAGSASVERPVSWANARSLHLRDAARLSFATASLIGAYSKLKGMAPQRITARYTIIPDASGKKKPRKITTVTHSVIAGLNVPSRAIQTG